MIEAMIEGLVASKGAEFATSLMTKVGFSESEANRFVPVLMKVVVGIFKKRVENDEGLDGIENEIDAAALAKEADVDEAKATAATKEVLPSMLEELKGSAGGDLGGLLGAAGSLFGGNKGGLGGLF